MDGVSIAASLVGLGTAGCQIAIKLYTLASQISTASQRISSVSNDISLTSGVLKELGEFMTRETATVGTSIFSQSGLETTKNSAAICEGIFSEIEQAAKEASEQLRTRDRIVGKIKLSKSEKAKWPFLQPSIESLRIDLREAKGTLMLMLQVMNLAVSQRMAAIHQTTTTSIVEQREIYRAILAIQKQSQGNISPQVKLLSIDGSSQGTPKVVAPPPQAYEVTVVSPSLAGQAGALDSPPALMALPDPSVLRKSKLEATNMNPSSGSEDTIDEARLDGMNSNSNRSSPGGDNTPQLNARVDNQREQRGKVLDYFVTKPIIKDDISGPDAISLRFWTHKIPMQQVDIRKKLFCSKEEGLQPVLDAYLELCDHERLIIDKLTEDIGSHTSLMLLKRTYADISYRGILFNGVPELQFIMERRMNENQNKSGDEAISETTSKARYKAVREAARREAREAAPRAAPRAAYEAEIEASRRAEMEAEMEAAKAELEAAKAEAREATPKAAREAARRAAYEAEIEAEIEAARRAARRAEVEAELEAAREAVRFHHHSPSPPESGEHDSDERPRGPQIRHHRHRSIDLSRERRGRQLNYQRLKNLEKLERKEDVVEPEDILREGKQSDDSDESSIMSDDAMNDEEAEKAVKELLEKYTTLGAVVGEVSGSG
ncbi:MAG: hypothetical protein L6R38_006464 [Xanthoria sp. 2 TBL-2021]|nr:MAG: hypothetical protein L6R38_006464 [Xanthoria sp. 2 TBL-2021]